MAARTKLASSIVAGIGVVLTIGLLWMSGPVPRTSAQPRLPKGFLRGYIVTTVGGNADNLAVAVVRLPSRDVYLPGVKVFLKNPTANVPTPPVLTDLSGRFTIPAVEGRYQICWEAKGFVNTCSMEIYSVSNWLSNIGKVHIAVDRVKETTVVTGKVSLADNSLPRAVEPLANINAFARVQLLAKDAVLDTVYVNNFGEYILPQVPAKEEIVLRAKIEGGASDHRILPGANLAGAAFHVIDLRFANHPPRVDPLVAVDGAGRRVAAAHPGETVHLQARASDPDGDRLKYVWLLSDGSGALSATIGPMVDWKLPAKEGLFTTTLTAYDGKGGYGRSSISVRVDTRGVLFSGTVKTTAGGVPVPGAEVEVNGVTGKTDAGGFVRLHVKDADKFVLNVRKQGFGLVSRIYDRGIVGAQWLLTAASVQTVDPTKPISVTQERRPSDCPGLPSASLRWREFPQAAVVQYQDGKGNVVAPPVKAKLTLATHLERISALVPPPSKGCGPGISVKVPANSLVDEGGHPPSGNIHVSLSTVDLMSPDQMPGDYTVKLPNNDTRVMESYGAGGVEFTAGGHRYNLKPGTTAQVRIPVDRAQLAAGGPLPATIPLLFYDEKNGVWIQEGNATRQGNFYIATVKHFSNINTDTIKVNQSCVDVIGPTMPATYELELTIPLGPGQAPKVPPPYAVTNQEYALYNLPSNTNIVLVPYDNTTKIPYGTFVVNTGGPQNPTKPNNPVGPPYHACSTQVTLSPQSLPQAPLFGEFLQGLGLSSPYEATNLGELSDADPTQHALKDALDQATANYYTQIDPRGKRILTAGGVCNLATDFSCFKALNGFSDDPLNPAAGETRAVYSNHGDLGFGRDMHCKKQMASDGQFDVACYVTNYGTILTDDQDDANAAITGTTVGASSLVATVAMEFSRIESPLGNPTEFDDPDRVVKFYVFNAAGKPAHAADLDSGVNVRPRPVPQLCMVCHGGNYPAATCAGPPPPPPPAGVPPFNCRDQVKFGSLFLPFDLHNYVFPTTATAQIPNPLKPGQQAAFQTLNQDIVLAANPGTNGQAIHDVISCTNVGDCMYPGGGPQDQHEDFVVPAAANSWQASADKQAMYKVVIANACRTCHVANPAINLRFTDSSQIINVPDPSRLGSAEARVCSQHVMPHAKRTHDLFWLSIGPHQPGEFQAFGDAIGDPTHNPNPATHLFGWQGNQCGVFTAGGATPPSLFTPVQNIFTGSGGCTGCHTGSSPPQGLNLDPANAYANLVDVNSSELPTMKRVSSTDHDPNHSYLFNKVNGTQAGLPGCPNITICFGPNKGPCGGKMPCGGSLSNTDLGTIQTWINGGAPP